MKICFVSDLHVDHNSGRIRWKDYPADLLIVAGDTSNSIGDTITTLKRASPHYPRIIVVDGNHEHYANAKQMRFVDETIERLRELAPSNVTFLNGDSVEKIGGFYFVGANGWFSVDCVGDPDANKATFYDNGKPPNDNYNIGFMETWGRSEWFQRQPWERAEDDAANIRARIEETLLDDPEARFIVVTHTAPHRDMVGWSPKDMMWNAFYVNSHMTRVMEDLGEHIHVWHHGHTHYRKEKTINGIYVIANPRGRYPENPGWEPVVIGF